MTPITPSREHGGCGSAVGSLSPVAHLLGAEAVHLAYPNQVIFDSVTLGVNDGARIGIVGRNGDGKSSLLGVLTGQIQPHSGRVTQRSGLRVSALSQADILDPSHTVGWTLVGDQPDHQWAGDARVRDVVDGLVSDIDWDATVSTLSGGQRRRVQLAQLLIGDWDVIALDEHTNHLDIEGITWLADHVKQRWARNSGGLLIVTHDRWFLDEVASTTWEVHDGVVEPFEGGYAAYVLQRVERDRQLAASEAKRQNLMRKELAWLRRGPPARTSKPKFRIEAANALIADEPVARDSAELLRFAGRRLGGKVLDAEDISLSFGDRPVLRHVTWRLGPGDRVALVGVNGSGKTSLMNILDGTLEPASGTVDRGQTVRIAHLSQDTAEIPGHLRVLESLEAVRGRATLADGQEITAALLVDRFASRGGRSRSLVKALGGGERRRLQLMRLLMDEPNVLLLDEPTNDLDIDTLTALEDLLDGWPGTLVVVSHDRYFVERVCDNVYALMGDGAIRHLPGGIDQYLELRHAAEAAEAAASPAALAPRAPGAGGASREARKEVARLERALDKLTTREAELHDSMAAAATD